jgi:hypothetical protein
MKLRSTLLATLFGLCCVPSFAQADPGKADPATADDPDAKSVATGSESRVILEAGDADAKATARLAHAFDLSDDYRARYAFTVTAPFDSRKADKADVGTLSGLTTGTSATLEFGVARWAQAGEAEALAVKAVCEKYIPQLIPGYTWSNVTKAIGELCRVDLFETAALAAVVKKLNGRRAGCAKCVDIPDQEPSLCGLLRKSREQSCANPDGTTAAVCALLEKNLREECAACEKPSAGELAACAELATIKHDAKLADAHEELLADANRALQPEAEKLFRPLTTLTLALKANQQHFDYVLVEDLATAKSSDKKGTGITVALTHVLRSSAWIVGYSHEESYKGSDVVQLCTPVGMTGATSCKQATIGAPKKETAELAFVENRMAIIGGRFGFAPRVEFDFKKSNWAVRLPLYFIANKDKQLTAGFALGYSEGEREKKKEEFGASVFISKAFTFY